jgi:hypothetical protein
VALNLRVLLQKGFLISKMDHNKVDCEGGKWMELHHGSCLMKGLILAVTNLDFCYRRCSRLIAQTAYY